MNGGAYPVKRIGLCSVVPSSVPVGLDSPCLCSRQRASPAWLRKWGVGLFNETLLNGRGDAAPDLTANCYNELLWCFVVVQSRCCWCMWLGVVGVCV